MRLAAVIAAALTLATAAAAATAPAGFYEAKRLEPAASYVAGKPAQIFCTESNLTWTEYAKANPNSVMSDPSALTVAGGSVSYFSPGACPTLLRELQDRKVDNYAFAWALLALVHESVHQRGIVDEGVTECTALHLMPKVAVRYFHIKAGKQLRALMQQAWVAYRAAGDAYRTVCG